ncbi:MAG TPA: P1 family peptidase [Acidimicrobiales bacterium]|nr:P1 family peptidase [Acidimicrobiales bacterium]
MWESLAPVGPGPHNAITDVPGVLVGHYQRLSEGWATGTTVVVTPGGAVGGVDIGGGAPGTRETDLLAPSAMVERVHAVCLTGGSAYGLAAADGVMCWLAEHAIGLPVGDEPHEVVPIVPAAVLFDLKQNAWGHRPDASFGYAACAGASDGPVAEGSVGAGTGATAGPMKGGIGTASVVLEGGFTIGALVALNARGHAVDPATGVPYGIGFGMDDEFAAWTAPAPSDAEAARDRLLATAKMPKLNTTLVILATDAALSKAECKVLAGVAQDGVARAVRPTHTLFDGDLVFSLATGERALELESTDAYAAGPSRAALVNDLAAAGADTVTRSVVHAVLAATTVGNSASYRDLFPTSFVGNSA